MRFLLICLWVLQGIVAFAQAEKLSTRLETPRSMKRDTLHGLKGTYSEGRWFKTQVLTRVDAQVNFDWGKESPEPRIETDYFWVTWEGSLYTPRAGTYTLTVLSDEGARLWLEDQLLIDAWDRDSLGEFSGSIFLQANVLHPIRLEYVDRREESLIRLFWQYEDEPAALIAERFLFNAVPEPDEEDPGFFDRFFSYFNWSKPDTQALSPPGARDISQAAKAETTSSPRKAQVPPVMPARPAASSVPPVKDTFQRPAPGAVIPLKQIQFEKSRYELRGDAYPELDSLAEVLIRYPELYIEVAGHTDFHPQSNPERNLQLSRLRAQTVADYLKEKGVPQARISVAGYGGAEPLASNETPEGREQNRRVEIRVKAP